MSRAIVVVDTETTGLDPDRHEVCEVAWLRVGTPGSGAGLFVPPHSLIGADPEALRINGYAKRLASLPVDASYATTRFLHGALSGNTLAGSSPAFDAAFLAGLFRRAGLDPRPWHHRLLDLSAYAAGVLGLDPAALPGLSDVCERLGVPRPEPKHTALADAADTVACFELLFRMKGVA